MESNKSKYAVTDDDEMPEEITSIKQIALQRISKIGDLVSQELTPGFWVKKPTKSSTGVTMQETYKPDLRIAYCNAIGFLADMVYPYSNDTFKEFMNSIYEKEEKNDVEPGENIKIHRKIFRNMMIMFEYESFFEGTDSMTEG